MLNRGFFKEGNIYREGVWSQSYIKEENTLKIYTKASLHFHYLKNGKEREKRPFFVRQSSTLLLRKAIVSLCMLSYIRQTPR